MMKYNEENERASLVRMMDARMQLRCAVQQTQRLRR